MSRWKAMVTAWSLLLAPGLPGQDSFVRTDARPAGEKGWDAFREGLARRGGAVFLLLGTEAQAQAWTELLEDEALADLGLEPQRVGGSTPLAADLRRRFGWDERPRWAALSPQGDLLATAPGLPERGAALAGALLAGGFEGRLQTLEAFLRRHPDHAEGHEALVKARFDLALRRTRAWRARRPGAAGPLPDAEDARIFRAFAHALERLLALPEWPSSFPILRWPADLPPPDSPLLAALARRHLPRVEAQLRRTPRSSQTWRLWQFLADASGGRPLLPLLDGIAARPDQTGFPAYTPIRRLAAELREAKAWQRLAEGFAPLADGYLGQPAVLFSLAEGVAVAWDDRLAPLLEAQLRLGLLAPADALVRRALEATRWPALPARAAALARSCGQPRLAGSWEALPLPEPRR